VTPLPSSPAAKAGIQRSDIIEEIDGVAAQSLLSEDGLSAVARRIRGKPGEAVTLGVRRKDSDQREEIRIVRSVINIDSVHGHRSSEGRQQYLLDEEEGVGYIQISAFSKTTPGEFDAAMRTLVSRGAKQLVLDLRGCPGGLLSSAIEIADSLIDEGKIVTVVSRDDPRQERCYTSPGPSKYPKWPMVVLVDRHTASAAEILAACLQDHDRATIVGERTWGRGIVHGIFPLKSGGGAVRLATAMFVRPGGNPIHRFDAADDSDDWGVKPDEAVALSDDERREVRRHREQDIRGATEDSAPKDRQLEKAIECLR
jgi:carboxyl-terminal processing protease